MRSVKHGRRRDYDYGRANSTNGFCSSNAIEEKRRETRGRYRNFHHYQQCYGVRCVRCFRKTHTDFIRYRAHFSITNRRAIMVVFKRPVSCDRIEMAASSQEAESRPTFRMPLRIICKIARGSHDASLRRRSIVPKLPLTLPECSG